MSLLESAHVYAIRKTKALIRLPGKAGWSVPLLFACNIFRVSGDKALFIFM